jgi:hypothetical protein
MWRKVVVELWSYCLQTFRQDGEADRSNVQVLVAKEPNFKFLISVLLTIALPLCLTGYQGTLNVHRAAENRWEGEEGTEDSMFDDRVLTVAVFVFTQTSCGTCTTGEWSSEICGQLNILMLESDSRTECKAVFLHAAICVKELEVQVHTFLSWPLGGHECSALNSGEGDLGTN